MLFQTDVEGFDIWNINNCTLACTQQQKGEHELRDMENQCRGFTRPTRLSAAHSNILPHGCTRVFRVLFISIFLPTGRPTDLK